MTIVTWDSAGRIDHWPVYASESLIWFQWGVDGCRSLWLMIANGFMETGVGEVWKKLWSILSGQETLFYSAGVLVAAAWHHFWWFRHSAYKYARVPEASAFRFKLRCRFRCKMDIRYCRRKPGRFRLRWWHATNIADHCSLWKLCWCLTLLYIHHWTLCMCALWVYIHLHSWPNEIETTTSPHVFSVSPSPRQKSIAPHSNPFPSPLHCPSLS